VNSPDKNLPFPDHKESSPSAFATESGIFNQLLPPRLLSTITGKSWKPDQVAPTVSISTPSSYGRHINRKKHDGSMPVEFSQHRQYSHGDEMRYIDWKIYGRKEKFFVKQFHTESIRRYYIVLDTSSSMGYPYSHKKNTGDIAVNKFQYASQVAAGCSYILISQGDTVGIVTSPFHNNDIVEAGSGWEHFNNAIIPTLAEKFHNSPEGIFEADKVAEKILTVCGRKNSVIIFISDLMIPGGSQKFVPIIRRLMSYGHQCVVIQVLHSDELNLPDGLSSEQSSSIVWELEDSETHSIVEVTPDIVKEYKKKISDEISFYKRGGSASSELIALGFTYHMFLTSIPIEKNFLLLV